jgi:hypothetical protein
MPQGDRSDVGQQPTSDWAKEHLSKEQAAIARLDRGDAYRKARDHKLAIAEYTGALDSGDLFMSLAQEARALFDRARSRHAIGDHGGPLLISTRPSARASCAL